MEMIKRATISHKKGAENPDIEINLPILAQALNKIEDFNNIVLMSGTAKRKSLEKIEKYSEPKLQKSNFKDSISKLRTPSYKSRSQQNHTEEKLMTKSCEILLECIKPYKDLHLAKKNRVTGTIRTGSILKTTNIIYERKATRKVQFISFSENDPESNFFPDHQDPSPSLLSTTSSEDFFNEILEVKDGERKIFYQTETTPNQIGKTVSSEDFVNKVFPQAEAAEFI